MLRGLFRDGFIFKVAPRTIVNHCLMCYASLHTKAPGDLSSELSVSTHCDNAYLMRKYKRRLLMILASIDTDEPLSQVEITNLAASPDGRILTVFWTVGAHPYNEAANRKVDFILQNASKKIRQRLSRENAFRKVPTLNFIHAPTNFSADPPKEQVDADSCHIVKPNNVYGLPWDKYMDEVKRKRVGDVVMVDTENGSADCLRDKGLFSSRSANWAKMWQKQHDSKLIAKRERRRSQQMLGMWQLIKEMEELD
ncbi:unnamed protein product [Hydatigera taeniaeformis]|uniref:Ribosome-binding factor A n=1 Tax=Hydatigena taeniaeformis TaxID=6205 RepID=A0A0R3X2R3_HYDTA|nr:unnamed protein product [Hydatigera taeniaeformis]